MKGYKSYTSLGSSLTHLIHSIAQLFATPSQPPHSRSLNCPKKSHTSSHTQSPCQCTIASVSKQSHISLVHQTTHLIHDHCMPKQSHTSSTRHIIHLMRDCFCAQTNRTPLRRAQSPTLCTIASVSEQSHTYYVRHNTHLIHDHLRAQTIAHLFGAPYHPPNARSLACPNNRTPLWHAQSPNPSCAQSIAYLFGAPSHTHSLSLCCPSHPPNARSLLCPKRSHTSLPCPVTHLMQSPYLTHSLPCLF